MKVLVYFNDEIHYLVLHTAYDKFDACAQLTEFTKTIGVNEFKFCLTFLSEEEFVQDRENLKQMFI